MTKHWTMFCNKGVSFFQMSKKTAMLQSPVSKVTKNFATVDPKLRLHYGENRMKLLILLMVTQSETVP